MTPTISRFSAGTKRSILAPSFTFHDAFPVT